MTDELQKIKDWLDTNDADYEQGLALLGKYSKNIMLKQALSRKKWPEKLRYELDKILRLHTNPQSIAAVKQENAHLEETEDLIVATQIMGVDLERGIIMQNGKALKTADLPEQLVPLHEFNLIGYKKVRSLHEKLKLMVDNTDEERKPIIAELDETMTKIRANWDVIDEWKEKGTTPTVEPPKGKKPQGVVDAKAVSNARSYISNNIEKLKGEKKADFLPKIQERVNTILKAGEPMGEELLKELETLGINVKAD